MADVVDYSELKPKLRPFTVYELIVVVPKIISQHKTYEDAAEVINKPHVVEESGEWIRKVPVGWKDDKIVDD